MPAVGNIQTIKRKIRAVQNLRKITKAMQMVSASKLKKVQSRLIQIRPYADKIDQLFKRLVAKVGKESHKLFQPRQNPKNAIVCVFSSDKGLCGSYNSNILNHTTRFIGEKNLSIQLVTLGKKGRDFFGKRNYTIKDSHVGIPTEVPAAKIHEIINLLVTSFESGEVDEVYLSYTKFVNALTYKPHTVKLIPVETPVQKAEDKTDYIYEPEPELILSMLIPKYLQISFHRILLESLSSEHAARMNAMKNATDNAEEVIYELTKIRNKVRQAGITKELLDIVTGAEAIKGG